MRPSDPRSLTSYELQPLKIRDRLRVNRPYYTAWPCENWSNDWLEGCTHKFCMHLFYFMTSPKANPIGSKPPKNRLPSNTKYFPPSLLRKSPNCAVKPPNWKLWAKGRGNCITGTFLSGGSIVRRQCCRRTKGNKRFWSCVGKAAQHDRTIYFML